MRLSTDILSLLRYLYTQYPAEIGIGMKGLLEYEAL